MTTATKKKQQQQQMGKLAKIATRENRNAKRNENNKKTIAAKKNLLNMTKIKTKMQSHSPRTLTCMYCTAA